MVSTDNPITRTAERCIAMAKDISKGSFHSLDAHNRLMEAAVEIDRLYMVAQRWKATAEALGSTLPAQRLDKEAKL